MQPLWSSVKYTLKAIHVPRSFRRELGGGEQNTGRPEISSAVVPLLSATLGDRTELRDDRWRRLTWLLWTSQTRVVLPVVEPRDSYSQVSQPETGT